MPCSESLVQHFPNVDGTEVVVVVPDDNATGFDPPNCKGSIVFHHGSTVITINKYRVEFSSKTGCREIQRASFSNLEFEAMLVAEQVPSLFGYLRRLCLF